MSRNFLKLCLFAAMEGLTIGKPRSWHVRGHFACACRHSFNPDPAENSCANPNHALASTIFCKARLIGRHHVAFWHEAITKAAAHQLQMRWFLPVGWPDQSCNREYWSTVNKSISLYQTFGPRSGPMMARVRPRVCDTVPGSGRSPLLHLQAGASDRVVHSILRLRHLRNDDNFVKVPFHFQPWSSSARGSNLKHSDDAFFVRLPLELWSIFLMHPRFKFAKQLGDVIGAPFPFCCHFSEDLRHLALEDSETRTLQHFVKNYSTGSWWNEEHCLYLVSANTLSYVYNVMSSYLRVSTLDMINWCPITPRLRPAWWGISPWVACSPCSLIWLYNLHHT